MNSGADGSIRAPYRGVAQLARRGPRPRRVAATRARGRSSSIAATASPSAPMAPPTAHETTIPFDIIPRVIAWDEWQFLHKGLSQRVRALNAFLTDAYGQREICRAGVIPEEQILMNGEFVADGAGAAAAGWRACPYRRHRSRARRREGLLRPRGQCAHAVGRVLRPGEPRSHDAAGARAVLGHARAAGRRLFRGAAGDPALGVVQRRATSPTSCC